jgi:hypothetical protein
MCDIHINGLSVVLTGHIIRELSIAPLFGMVVLTEAGCKVQFDKSACMVWYNNKIIVKDGKAKAINLWTLPIGTNPSMSSHHNAVATPSTAPVSVDAHAHYATMQIAFCMHTDQTKANSIRFVHQSLCSPRIYTLLKAIRRGFLKGCPNLSVAGVTRYLNPSPATAKGHMKWPRMGIISTRQNKIHANVMPPVPDNPRDLDSISINHSSVSPIPLCPSNANIIKTDNVSSDANIFCFAAFANKQTGILYNDLTGAFPFMSLEGNVCFLIAYHYKTNAILALPIKGFSNKNYICRLSTTIQHVRSQGIQNKT